MLSAFPFDAVMSRVGIASAAFVVDVVHSGRYAGGANGEERGETEHLFFICNFLSLIMMYEVAIFFGQRQSEEYDPKALHD